MRGAVEELDTCFYPLSFVVIVRGGLGKDQTEAALIEEGFPVCRDGNAGAAEGGEREGAVEDGGVEGVEMRGFAPDVGAWGGGEGEDARERRGRGAGFG